MMYKRSLLLLFLAIAGSQTVLAHSGVDEAPQPLPQPEKALLGSFVDAEILSEHNKIIVYGQRAERMFVRVEKEVQFVFNTTEAIDKYGSLRLPESVDPAYDYQAIPWDKRDTWHRPFYASLQMKKFEAFILDKNNEWEPIGTTKSVGGRSEFIEQIERRLEYYNYDLQGLKPGHQVLVRYSWEIPYDVNAKLFNCWRYFFNGKLDKAKFSLTVVAPKRLFNTFQATQPDSMWVEGSRQYRKWKRKEVIGCIQEKNARPYEALDHVNLTLNTNSLNYQFVDNVTGLARNSSYWVNEVKYRERRALWLLRLAKKPRFFDKQNIQMETFMERTTSGMSRNSPHAKLIALHHTIADDFTYQQDSLYYYGFDVGLERIGDHTSEKILRDISRFNMYVKMSSRLGLMYSTCYLSDKRVGLIGSNYMSPIWNNDFAFVFPTQTGTLYLHPKKARFGLKANEFPFYWENSSALMVNLNILYGEDPEQKHFLTLPSSDAEQNYRHTSVEAKVATKDGDIDYRSRIVLSGQFSTLTRGNYLYGYQDSTINPRYFATIFDRDGVRVTRNENTSQNEGFPFGCQLEVEFTEKQYGSNTVSLAGWFNAYYPEASTERPREQDFYQDFLFRDHFDYLVKFDAPITVLNLAELNKVVETPYYTIVLRAEHQSETTVMLVLDYQLKESIVPASQYHQMVDLQRVLKEMDALKIRYEL